MALLPNPIVLQRADPFVYKDGDSYLFTGSYPTYDRIVLRRANKLSELQEAEEFTIWRKHDSGTGAMSELIWAPEIHKIGNQWVIYFRSITYHGYSSNCRHFPTSHFLLNLR